MRSSAPAAESAVVLVGPPGAGKSTVGPLLAGLLGVAFTDTDSLVAESAGKPVSDIFVEDGEAMFRMMERSAVQAALRAPAGVIALGGGAVADPGSQALLAGQRVVYLETGFGAVARRTGIDGPHPPIPGNPRGRLRQMLEERRAQYEGVAWLTVSTDDKSQQEIAEQIAAAVAREPGPEPLP
jgi:shikimate kinase